jgi:MoxR-like ATPase
MLNDHTTSTDAVTAPAAGPVPADLTDRLRKLRDSLLTGLVERDVPIRLALLAALTGEHLLLVGPPGTAKSVLARRLHLAFKDATYFERLLTKFSVPEELFGPLSIKGLEEDRYERQIDRYLPTASVAFLDEIFKANSAILNALLTLLNEREFDNGCERRPTPLISVIGASNELAEGDELDALFDRFLLRFHVVPVTAKSFPALLALRGDAQPEVEDALSFTTDELRAVQAAATRVEVPDDLVAMLADLRDWCAAQDIPVSDRRWRKVVKLLQVSALSNGRPKASVWDAWLLQHCVWSKPEDAEKVFKWYSDRVGASASFDPSRLTKIVVSWEATLKADQEHQAQRRDDQGRPLFVLPDGKLTSNAKERVQKKRGKERLFLAPSPSATDYYMRQPIEDRTGARRGYTQAELDELYVGPHAQFAQWPRRNAYLADEKNWFVGVGEVGPAMEPTRHKPVYVDECLRQVDAVREDVARYKVGLLAHVSALEVDIRSHLWVTADFLGPASKSLKRTWTEVGGLLARIERVRQGIEQLPREAPLSALAGTIGSEGA